MPHFLMTSDNRCISPSSNSLADSFFPYGDSGSRAPPVPWLCHPLFKWPMGKKSIEECHTVLAQPGSGASHFCSHYIGQNSVTWLHLTNCKGA